MCAQFQSAPAIAGGRIWLASSAARPMACFNPRPPLLAGESSLQSTRQRLGWFQSAPAIAGGRILIRAAWVPGCLQSFNPRPPLLAGESCRPSPGPVRWGCFNPRPPLLAGESQRLRPYSQVRRFQSAPAIAGGRIPELAARARCTRWRFNPRPPLLAGESAWYEALPICRAVSIRARHCWRANRRCNQHGRGLAGFNPRPPLLAGESPSGHRRWSDSQGFNPRPPLLAGESSLIQSMEGTWVFQSAPAIAGGRIFALLLT